MTLSQSTPKTLLHQTRKTQRTMRLQPWLTLTWISTARKLNNIRDARCRPMLLRLLSRPSISESLLLATEGFSKNTKPDAEISLSYPSDRQLAHGNTMIRTHQIIGDRFRLVTCVFHRTLSAFVISTFTSGATDSHTSEIQHPTSRPPRSFKCTPTSNPHSRSTGTVRCAEP